MKLMGGMALFAVGLIAGEIATFGIILTTFAVLLPIVGRSGGWRVAAILVVSGASVCSWARWILPRRDALAVGSGVGTIFGAIAGLMVGFH